MLTVQTLSPRHTTSFDRIYSVFISSPLPFLPPTSVSAHLELEAAHWLRALAALAQVSISITALMLTNICKPSSKESDTLLTSVGTRYMCAAHTCQQTLMQSIDLILNKEDL